MPGLLSGYELCLKGFHVFLIPSNYFWNNCHWFKLLSPISLLAESWWNCSLRCIFKHCQGHTQAYKLTLKIEIILNGLPYGTQWTINFHEDELFLKPNCSFAKLWLQFMWWYSLLYTIFTNIFEKDVSKEVVLYFHKFVLSPFFKIKV
jgi:hypothetical protein